MYKNLTTLFDYRVKRYGLICAPIILVLDIITYFIPGFSFIHYDHHILFHYMILFCLIVVATSKDKLDDELSQQIRYSVFKNTLTLSVALMALAVMILSVLQIDHIPTIIIIYFLEGMLVLHLLLYYFGHRANADWLLTEKTAPEPFNRMAKGFMVGIIILLVVLILITLFEL